MFLLNSRYSLVCVPHPWLPINEACLSRSYACNLPSSFNIVLSSALVYSTYPPVSVSGTVSRLSYFLDPLHCTSNPLRMYNLRKPSLQTGWGLLTPFPSTTPLSLVLGTGSPCADYLYAGTLGFSATGSSTLFVVTHVSIRTSDTSRIPHDIPSQAYRTLRYYLVFLLNPQFRCMVLAPLHLRRRTS